MSELFYRSSSHWRCGETIARCEASGLNDKVTRTEGAGDLRHLQCGIIFYPRSQKLRIWLLSRRTFSAMFLEFDNDGLNFYNYKFDLSSLFW